MPKIDSEQSTSLKPLWLAPNFSNPKCFGLGVTENGENLLSGLTLSGARFRLPAKKGEVREPAWSGFLR